MDALPAGHAGKPDEIEEWTDRHFTRPIGSIFTNIAVAMRLTPSQVTVANGIAGIMGGALLYDLRFGWLGFGLLWLHAILDSADGQLARQTGQATEFGRVLDGISGYVTHIAIFIGITAGCLQRGAAPTLIGWMLLAAIATIGHAQAHEYHGTTYSSVVKEGRVRPNHPGRVSIWLRGVYYTYSVIQRLVVGQHEEVITALHARAGGNLILEEDRQRYRDSFSRLVRCWNLLGDNTRRYAVGLVVFLQRPEWLFAIILIPMNVAFIAFWLWQRNADRAFLAATPND